MTFMRGGCLCIPSEMDRVNNLTVAMNNLEVTHACLTTSTISQIQPDHVSSLEHLLVGGEPLSKTEYF